MQSISAKKAVVWESGSASNPSPDDDANTSVYAVTATFQHKTFYTQGLFWLFYNCNNRLVYRTSSDGETWSAKTDIRESSGDFPDIDFVFDGSYFHYAICLSDSVVYRRGLPNVDGSITWDTEQTVKARAGVDYYFYYPSITVDSNGYPWIGYLTQNSSLSESRLYITKSDTKNGTWTTTSGFPLLLSLNTYAYVSVLPLTNLKVYVIYVTDGQTVKGRLWNGSAWETEETVSTSTIARALFCAISHGDSIHLAFTKSSTFDLIHIKYTYGTGWGSEATIQASTQDYTSPALCRDILTGDIFCFWIGSPTANHIYYKKYSNNLWDAESTDWFESPFAITHSFDGLTCFDKSYNNKIGLAYQDYGAIWVLYTHVGFNYLYVK
jgi:hypothetical protein